MKKILMTLCFVSLAALSFVSCQKEEVGENPVLGKWCAKGATWNGVECDIHLNVTTATYDADTQDTTYGRMQVKVGGEVKLDYRIMGCIYTPETMSGQFIVEDASFGDRGMNPMFYYDPDEDCLRVIDVYFNLTFRREK